MKRKVPLLASIMSAVLGVLCTAVVGWAGDWAGGGVQPTVNVAEYYPLQDGNTWIYQVKEYRADGQVFYRLSREIVKGEAHVNDHVTAKKLVDDRGNYYLVSVDPSQLMFYGHNEGRGDVTYNPPYTILSVNYEAGKPYRSPHVPSTGQPVFSEATVYGFESIEVPAGRFKDCVKVTFQYTRPSGATHTITSYLAKGVGLVKEVHEIYSPAANQTLRSERELLNGTVNSAKIGGDAAQTVKIAEYFPFHQGDKWTYNWEFRLPDGTVKSFERTRRFEGTRFFDAGAAFKLVDDTGEEYQYYSLDRRTGLQIVMSRERGVRAQGVEFMYDPPMLLGRDDMVLGQEYKYTQDGETLTHFTTVLDGFQPVIAPMGRFENCLRVCVNWETKSRSVRSVYYLARGIGIVGYDYSNFSKSNRQLAIASHGELKQATINGNVVASAKDAADLLERMKAQLAAASEDPEARRLFKEASLNRYVWDAKLGFRGFEAGFIMGVDGGEPTQGHLHCAPNLKITIDHPDPKIRALAHVEMSQFVTHREPRVPFDDWYGPDKAKFKLGEKTPEGQRILVEGDAMGSSYIIGEKMVKYLSRNVDRLDFTIHNKKHMSAEDGRYIAIEYEVTFYKKGTKEEVGKAQFTDMYFKKDQYWVPKGRIHLSTLPNELSRIEMEIINLEYLK
ncbi:MAG: DUF3386 family protein [Acidobacteria bacterium]|nr:DUF3386 family protein [Acidobacteriota bacterium]